VACTAQQNGITQLASKSARVAGQYQGARNGRKDSDLQPLPLTPVPLTPEQVKKERARKAENTRKFVSAIKRQHKVSVFYRSPRGVRKYALIPLDVKRGRTVETKARKYMWAYSDKAGTLISLRQDRVMSVKELEKEPFDTAELAKLWNGKTIKWTLPRKWGSTSSMKEKA
jgi:hypothetical protein